jgi:hypothetical protein
MPLPLRRGTPLAAGVLSLVVLFSGCSSSLSHDSTTSASTPAAAQLALEHDGRVFRGDGWEFTIPEPATFDAIEPNGDETMHVTYVDPQHHVTGEILVATHPGDDRVAAAVSDYIDGFRGDPGFALVSRDSIYVPGVPQRAQRAVVVHGDVADGIYAYPVGTDGVLVLTFTFPANQMVDLTTRALIDSIRSTPAPAR